MFPDRCGRLVNTIVVQWKNAMNCIDYSVKKTAKFFACSLSRRRSRLPAADIGENLQAIIDASKRAQFLLPTRGRSQSKGFPHHAGWHQNIEQPTEKHCWRRPHQCFHGRRVELTIWAANSQLLKALVLRISPCGSHSEFFSFPSNFSLLFVFRFSLCDSSSEFLLDIRLSNS